MLQFDKYLLARELRTAKMSHKSRSLWESAENEKRKKKNSKKKHYSKKFQLLSRSLLPATFNLLLSEWLISIFTAVEPRAKSLCFARAGTGTKTSMNRALRFSTRRSKYFKSIAKMINLQADSRSAHIFAEVSNDLHPHHRVIIHQKLLVSERERVKRRKKLLYHLFNEISLNGWWQACNECSRAWANKKIANPAKKKSWRRDRFSSLKLHLIGLSSSAAAVYARI